MITDTYVDPSAVQRVARDLHRLGDAPQARKYYFKMLEMQPAEKAYHASAYFDLAALEQSLPAKMELLEKVLELQPRHVMAGIILQSLTPAMQKRVMRHKDTLLPMFGYGLNVQLQTTSHCNASCIMCPYSDSYHKQHPNVMSDRTFDKSLDLLEGFPLRKVCLYLNNEPFLDTNLFARIEQVKSRLTFDHIEISTNGSALTEKNIHRLYEALRDTRHEIWYSWHGVTREVYQRVMGLDFDQNLVRLKSYLKITQGKLKTVFRTITGGRLHVDQQFSTREEAEKFFYNVTVEAGLDPAAARTTIQPFTFHDRAGNVDFNGAQDPEVARRQGKLKPDCPRLFEWLHILDDGYVILCCMDFHKETATVDVNDFSSLEDLLSSGPVSRLRNQALGREESSREFICRRCTSPGG